MLMSGDLFLVISSKDERRWFFRIERESTLLSATSGLQLLCLSTCDSSKLLRFFKIPCRLFVMAGSTTLGENVTGVCVVEGKPSGRLSSLDTFLFNIDTGPDGIGTWVIIGISRTGPSMDFFFKIEEGGFDSGTSVRVLGAVFVLSEHLESGFLVAPTSILRSKDLLTKVSTLAKVSWVSAVISSSLFDVLTLLDVCSSPLTAFLSFLVVLLQSLKCLFLPLSVSTSKEPSGLEAEPLDLSLEMRRTAFVLPISEKAGAIPLRAFSMWMLSSLFLGLVRVGILEAVIGDDKDEVRKAVRELSLFVFSSFELAFTASSNTSGGKYLRRLLRFFPSSVRGTS